MKRSDARPRILHACKLLTESEKKGASYADIREITGLSLSIVKDHAQRMKDTGALIWVADGFYRHPETREEFPVSVSVLRDGRHRIECGPRSMTISQGSARLLKMAFGNHGSVGKSSTLDLDDEVTITVLLDGSAKLECGDEVMELTAIGARLLRAAVG